MHNTSKFYVTTPIYYVTAKPHLGSLYSTLIADVLARWNKLSGKEVFFLTGTDEHGQKIAQAAQKVGQEPKAFVDSFIPAYKEAWKKYEIDYSYFIRTTDSNHIAAVQLWLQQMQERGDVYKSVYSGWYCTPCETFLTEKEVHEQAKKVPSCPNCSRDTTYISEETYFFKLSAYQDKLLAFYEQHPNFIQPRERMAEVVNFVKSGLKDLSISRTTITWGIPFTHDPTHVAYVWADALANYITAIGFNQKGKEDEFARWWPADVHVMGKDIVRFHAVYWPAFLMASQLPLPKTLLVHGWIKIGDQKMSKSLGNAVDPIVLAETYGVDEIRYYLMRSLAITHDGEFSIADIEQKIGSELANDLGNLLNRMVLLAEKYDALKIDAPADRDLAARELHAKSREVVFETGEHMNNYMIHMAIARIWQYINQVNAYFHANEPWKLAKSNGDQFKAVLSATAHALRTIAVLTSPIMPEKMKALLASIGIVHDPKISLQDMNLDEWNQTFHLKRIDVLFIRPEKTVESEKQMQEQQTVQPTTPAISIDDFIKVELRIGMIEKAEFVEKSDKLLKLQVNFGPHGMRQIFSGIRKHYMPEQLIGKQGTFVFNLAPRKMMGEESQGMMLFAEDAAGALQIVAPTLLVPNGTQLK